MKGLLLKAEMVVFPKGEEWEQEWARGRGKVRGEKIPNNVKDWLWKADESTDSPLNGVME